VPPVYVVILAHGGREWLKAFLPSILATEYPSFTVWVIDNASEPPLVPWLKENFPTVKTLRYEENLGYAGGYQHFFSAHGHEVPYMALLNSDVEVTALWLSALVKCMETHPGLAAVQPKVLSWHDKTAFEYAGAAGGFLDPWGYPTCRGRGEKDYGQYDKPCQIFWASGAAFLLRTKAVLESQKGLLFKPYYFMHMEEIDLCWRLQRAGWMVGYEPTSVVYHVGGASLHPKKPQKTYYNFRNSLLMLWENLRGIEQYRKVFWRLLLDAPAAIYLWMRAGWPHVRAIARAHWDFFRYLRQKSRPALPELPYLPYKKLKGLTPRPWKFGTGSIPCLPLEA
jgi:GT2 family glycosyltransferase